MAERRRPVALEDGMGEPGAAIAGERRGDEQAPIGTERGGEEKGEGKRAAEIMGEPRPRIAMGAQVMRPERGLAGDRLGHAGSLPQNCALPQAAAGLTLPASFPILTS